ncbi:MAG: FAD-dependent oxidoreductase [Ruminococcaceae bacterium]|nr:FAD-dependent oxidoreductase [Oscillospiraceae bacterium]
MHDIIVVGAGPAGLTAALYARRMGKSVLVLEKSTFGGQITFSPKIENYPGTMQMSGTEFADRLVEQVLAQDAEIEMETVTGIEDHGDTKTVVTEEGRHDCRSVIIAAGVRHRQLGLSRENEFVGEGISYCAVCDGAFYKGQHVAMVGGGNSALQEAILLSETCSKVTVVQNLPFLTGEQSLQDVLATRQNVEVILSTVVTGLLGDSTLTGIEIRNEESGEVSTLSVDGVFVAIGLEPVNEAFAEIAALDERGYFDADEACTTKTPGVYVAGDCRKKGIRQITTAVADGATAALAACRYIDSL